MKILITGSNGLLGQKLIYRLKQNPDISVIATSKGENRLDDKIGYQYFSLDITQRNEVLELIDKVKPDCIINTAAMTNVDACEADQAGCKKLNIDAVEYLIEASGNCNAHLIHISTDFVFDGEKGPYKEVDQPNPQSYYAWSKLESEKLVMKSGLQWAILRTIIIYGVTDGVQRSNLVLWTKSSLEQGKKINVITDQFRSPTLAEDLADACIATAMKKATGIFHVSGPQSDLKSILELAYDVADYFNLDKSLIQPVTSEQLNQPAKRPRYTGFILEKAETILEYQPHSFKEGLKIIEDQLKKK